MQKHIKKIAEHAKSASAYLFLLLGALMLVMVFRAALFGHLGEEKHIWVEISLLLLVALVAERIIQQWKQPFVMVLLLLGLALSPHTLSVAWPAMVSFASPMLSTFGIDAATIGAPELVGESQIIKTFANVGVIILLFRIGLHSEIDKVFNLKNLLIALGGVILPFAAGFLYSQSTGAGLAFSLFVGAALTATSVGITVAVLDEMKMLGRPFAQAILGAAVIDDILALIVLGLVSNMPTSLSSDAILPIAKIIGVAFVFIVSGLMMGKLFVERFFGKDEEELSKWTLSGMLAILFFYSFASEALGLSAIVGAFIAGLVISHSPLSQKLNKALFPLDVLFTPIFFISLGMLMNIWDIPGAIVPVMVLTLIAALTKVVGCGIPAMLSGMNLKESFAIGWGMVPRGEIALIIALLGVTMVDASGKPILDSAEYTIIASMAFVSTIIVPPLLKQIVAWAEKK